MKDLTVRSVLLNPFQNDKPLTPAMVLALWVIADAVDKLKLAEGHDSTVELTIPTARLRGTEGRSDNAWLRKCLDRMTGLKIGGTYRGMEWGAVILAEWRIEQGGAMAKLYLPPSSVQAMRAGDTFARIEAYAAYKLQGHARTLYGALADKKRMGNKYWVFSVDELRGLLSVADKKSYQRFNNFRQWVLDPALEQINDFGTVSVDMNPLKVGRSVDAVRFDWVWKTISEARETDEENERPTIARRKSEDSRDMPPLSQSPANNAESAPKLSQEERAEISDRIMREAGFKR